MRGDRIGSPKQSRSNFPILLRRLRFGPGQGDCGWVDLSGLESVRRGLADQSNRHREVLPHILNTFDARAVGHGFDGLD